MDRKVILYIEDDDAAFELVRIILSEEAPRAQLRRARDGEEAMSVLLNQPQGWADAPDLILLDINLPKMSGLRVLSELKAREPLSNIPVVMFSTSSAPTDRHTALAGGAIGYITKPTSFDLFVEAVRVACSLPEQLSKAASKTE